MEKVKTVLFVAWADGRKETYTTIPAFINTNPGKGFNRHTIISYLNRAKTPYMDTHCTIQRIPLIGKKHGN